jgi:MFS family permease
MWLLFAYPIFWAFEREHLRRHDRHIRQALLMSAITSSILVAIPFIVSAVSDPSLLGWWFSAEWWRLLLWALAVVAALIAPGALAQAWVLARHNNRIERTRDP